MWLMGERLALHVVSEAEYYLTAGNVWFFLGGNDL